MKFLVPLFLASVCFGQQWEIGGAGGYGWYRTDTIYSSAGDAQAGIRNRFVAGFVVDEDAFEYLSGEFRYLYQDGDPYISYGGVKANVNGQSHAIDYEVLIHVVPRNRRVRPFFAAGVGGKDYVVTGPEPYPQPLPQIATLTNQSEWKGLFTAGAGIKFQLNPYVLVRVDFRDYITKFPEQIFIPAPHGTDRGIFNQFTPMFGISCTIPTGR